MARPTLPAAIIAQRGVPITLLDGTEKVLVCTFRSLLVIEEEFGSVQRALDSLDFVANKDAKAFAAINGLMAACLGHEVIGPDGTMVTADVLADYIDPALMAEYGQAIGAAVTKAFPKQAEGAQEPGHQEQEPDDVADPTPPSPGSPGTTSPSSPGVGTPSGSGGAHLLSSAV